MPWYHCETTARFLNLGGAGPHKKSQTFKEGAISANLKMSIVKAQNAGHARKIVVRFKKLAQRANYCKMWCFSIAMRCEWFAKEPTIFFFVECVVDRILLHPKEIGCYRGVGFKDTMSAS